MDMNKNAYRSELDRIRYTEEGRTALLDSLMNRETAPVRRVSWVKRGAVAGLAAVLLVGTAMAAAGPVWETFFGHLDEDQREVIESLSQDLPAAESNGAIMTPLAAFGDQDFYYLMLEITPPDGTVLPVYSPDEGFYQLSDGNGDHMTLTNGAGEDISGGWDYDWMERSGEEDKLTVVIRFWPREGVDFSDGTDKFLHIPGLWVQSPDKEYTPVFTGSWEFNIGTHTGGIESRTLDVAGTTTEHELLSGGLTLDELRISPLGMRWRYHWDRPAEMVVPDVAAVVAAPGAEWEPMVSFIPGVEIAVVMEDGREISLSGTMGSWDEDACWNESYAAFEAPIDLSKAVTIRWGTAEIPLS